MDKLKIYGNADLFGSIDVPGAKNSALPVMVASLLSQEELILKNIPNLQDILSMKKLLESFWIKIKEEKNIIALNAKQITNKTADYDLVRKMIASILVLGPLLSRFKKVKISLPGGCAIGTRPIDIHLFGLEKLGVKFTFEKGYIYGQIKNNLVGSFIDLPF